MTGVSAAKHARNVHYILATIACIILVDGGWSQWGQWSDCSSTCGFGVMSRSRPCTDPVPQQNGKPCNGSHEDSLQCILSYCPGMTLLLLLQLTTVHTVRTACTTVQAAITACTVVQAVV